ncbi:MAG: sporulation protein [candidate division Zixibacteria bacterium]|nr:sporulation protein [candidate division Zixibacteria bacterium]
MENPAQELIKSILDELKAIAKTETIVGEPITIGDKTIVPVCKITLGFGAGGGTGGAKDKGEGTGSGGGGGVAIFPAAFIVIKGDEVSVLGVKPGKWEYILEAIPGIIEKFREGKKGKKEKEEKTE